MSGYIRLLWLVQIVWLSKVTLVYANCGLVNLGYFILVYIKKVHVK
jgi:hypothetical protein